MKLPLSLLVLALLGGCASRTYTGGSEKVNLGWGPVFIGFFQNATTDENAAQTITDLVGTALSARGITILTAEAAGGGAKNESPGEAANLLEQARQAKATYLVTGTVHEYRYKTDLNGDPAVGLTLRLLNVADGRTVWQGTSSQVGIAFGSLTSTAQKAVHKLIAKLPLRK